MLQDEGEHTNLQWRREQEDFSTDRWKISGQLQPPQWRTGSEKQDKTHEESAFRIEQEDKVKTAAGSNTDHDIN